MAKRVHLTAWFGNGDEYDCHLRLNVGDWKRILAGEPYVDSSTFYGDEGRQWAYWSFNRPGGSELEISGDDGAEYFEGPLSELSLEIGGIEQPWRGLPR